MSAGDARHREKPDHGGLEVAFGVRALAHVLPALGPLEVVARVTLSANLVEMLEQLRDKDTEIQNLKAQLSALLSGAEDEVGEEESEGAAKEDD